ncbi:hypothetical protein LZ30DRAFT_740205 [Colletotrichum cereale]|nr:hypothetical protein LZ30DRAFT_740205 [Colletotrichum cereale]
MTHLSLILLHTLVWGLFSTSLADNIKNFRLLSRTYDSELPGYDPVDPKPCEYHCGKGITGPCSYTLDPDFGEYYCTDAPPPTPSAKKYDYLAKVADRAGVKLLPETYYYFRSCTRSPVPENHPGTHWVMAQTGGCNHIALIVGKTSSDNKEFEGTYVTTYGMFGGGWHIGAREWWGPGGNGYQTASYGGIIPPEKAEISMILSQGADWNARSEGRFDSEWNCLTFYDDVVSIFK